MSRKKHRIRQKITMKYITKVKNEGEIEEENKILHPCEQITKNVQSA